MFNRKTDVAVWFWQGSGYYWLAGFHRHRHTSEAAYSQADTVWPHPIYTFDLMHWRSSKNRDLERMTANAPEPRTNKSSSPSSSLFSLSVLGFNSNFPTVKKIAFITDPFGIDNFVLNKSKRRFVRPSWITRCWEKDDVSFPWTNILGIYAFPPISP